jgi:hypothetical protein
MAVQPHHSGRNSEIHRIRPYTLLPPRYASAQRCIKKQWANGIQLTGKVEQLAVTGVQAQPQHLSVALQVLATLQVTLSTQVLKL